MQTQNSLIGIGLLGIGSILLFQKMRKAEAERREQIILQQTGSNANVQQAQLLRQAMNPNKPLPMGWDGTDEKLILQTSNAITDLASVQKAYRSLYNGADLMKDLRSELSSGDFEKFIWQINNNAKTKTEIKVNGEMTSTNVQTSKSYALGKNYKVWALKDVVLRSTPEANSVQGNILSQLRFAWEEGNFITAPKANIIEMCKANQFIGYTTGNSKIDVQHHVPFIEVTFKIKGDYKGATANMKNKHGQIVRGWVSASANFTKQTTSFKEALDKGFKLPIYKS